jgi:UDPglucose 6-dehydrogenase
MRDSPSISIAARMVGEGAVLRVFDPQGMEQARPMMPPETVYCESALDAALGADVLVVVTEWNEFRAITPNQLKSAMMGRVVVDLRNVYEPAALAAAGFAYHSIGRPSVGG